MCLSGSCKAGLRYPVVSNLGMPATRIKELKVLRAKRRTSDLLQKREKRFTKEPVLSSGKAADSHVESPESTDDSGLTSSSSRGSDISDDPRSPSSSSSSGIFDLLDDDLDSDWSTSPPRTPPTANGPAPHARTNISSTLSQLLSSSSPSSSTQLHLPLPSSEAWCRTWLSSESSSGPTPSAVCDSDSSPHCEDSSSSSSGYSSCSSSERDSPPAVSKHPPSPCNIRFPAPPKRGLICQWARCGISLSPSNLHDHLLKSHVKTQSPTAKNNAGKRTGVLSARPTYSCSWVGCKVFQKPSLSIGWLERHVLTHHAGLKPFKCILQGCDSRFSSKVLLERHVNNHFASPPASATATAAAEPHAHPPTPPSASASTAPVETASSSSSKQIKKDLTKRSQRRSSASATSSSASASDGSLPPAPAAPVVSSNAADALDGAQADLNDLHKHESKKIIRKNGKKLRVRNKLYSARLWDHWDAGIMSRLRHQLNYITYESPLAHLRPDNRQTTLTDITLECKVLACRITESGKEEYHVNYSPEGILPDAWVPSGSFSPRVTLSMGQIPPSGRSTLETLMFGCANPPTRLRRNKRK
ncbi:unnamed protein product [Cyprideis torosa]|uniref:Uncharacterized protein n=1 Tax=Cyprideis torosa TaxID=163714 RepID=A0A7R8ZIC2_9CRUS|nr:unnamed protein product [Cyprideis torosa]CAG0879638.1 unnamed protein product [Cyprideis torosa]